MIVKPVADGFDVVGTTLVCLEFLEGLLAFDVVVFFGAVETDPPVLGEEVCGGVEGADGAGVTGGGAVGGVVDGGGAVGGFGGVGGGGGAGLTMV